MVPKSRTPPQKGRGNSRVKYAERFAPSVTSAYDRRVWLLTIGQALLSVGRGVIMPFATIYFYDVQGFPLALIGLAFAIAMPAGAVVGLAWGALSDRIGRKPLMLLGFAGQAVSTALLAFVSTVPQYTLVIVGNFVAVAAWNPSARAMVADVTPPERRTRAYGLLYLSNNAGISAGLLLGGALAIVLPYRALFFIEAAGALAFMLVVALAVQESHRGASAMAQRGLARIAEHFRGISRPLRDARFLLFALAAILAGLGWAQFYITYSPYMASYLGFPDTAIAVVFAINTVMVVLLQVAIAAWAEKRRRTYVYVVANHLLAWSLLMTWASGRIDGDVQRFAMLAGAIAVMTLGEIMVVPVGSALVASMAGGEQDFGKYMAGLELVWTTASGAGAIVGGVFFDIGRPMLLWPVMTAFVVLSFGAYWMLGRALPREVNDPAAVAREKAAAAAPS